MADKALIYAERQTNLAIMGRGTIDGQGDKLAVHRKYLVNPLVCRFVECRHVMTRDITMQNSPMWMHHHLGLLTTWWSMVWPLRNCSTFKINCLTMDCCQNVHVANCDFTSNDDCFELEESSNAPSARTSP